MIMIQTRRREKKATIKDVKLSHKGPLPTCTSFLHTPKILKLSQKLTFPTEIEPTTCSAKKRGSKKSEKKGGESKSKKKKKRPKLFNPNFAFFHMNANFAN